MTPTWIICESTSRWAAAMRVAATHHSLTLPHSRIEEVRSLAELVDRLAQVPNSLVLLEVTCRNLEASLTWLAVHSRGKSTAPVVALLDLCKYGSSASPAIGNGDAESLSDEAGIVSGALREAGAIDILHSPRQIRSALALGQRHTASCLSADPARPDAEQSFADWAWSLLPWQDADRQLG